MQSWPALADTAKLLKTRGGRETLFYYAAGGGGAVRDPAAKAPLLVLIHGLGDEADSWRSLIPLLRERCRVLAPDLPGFGRSAAPGRIGIKRHIAAIVRLLEAEGAGPGNPAVLAGNSLGALVAEGVAVSRPRLVKALILIDGCFPMGTKPDAGLLFLCLPFLGKRWYRRFRTDYEAAYRSLFPYYADFRAMAETERRFLRGRVIERVESETQERAYFASLRSTVWTFLTAGPRWLKKLSALLRGGVVPSRGGTGDASKRLLMIWGEKDVIMPQAAAKPLREAFPEAAFTVVAGAGHLPHQEKPAETAAAILRFLDPDVGFGNYTGQQHLLSKG
ncbi:MAG: alpha/beta hydrolase [Treponema sp.]|jgi:pimeloyl-ACP methyl ester carboxylesterase|nr:alpha/beta hydrolase [Treponema sp.]